MASRPVVVLMSGQLLTAETWAAQVPALARDYDLRYADHVHDDTIAAMSERLLAELPQRFSIVAHAMGGFVAFETLRRAPERVERVALLSTLAPSDGLAQTERRQGYIQLVQDGRFDQVVEERIPILVHPARREDDALLSRVRRMAIQTGPKTFLRQQRAIMSRADSRPSLALIDCPTLIVWGRQDGIASLPQQEEMSAGVPGAHLEIIEDCGHLSPMERPVTVTGLLQDWLGAKIAT